MKTSVLVIDDEKDIGNILVEYLESLNCKACYANSVQEADKLRAKDGFDLVISDIHMPGKSGLVYFEELRLNPDNNLPPWVFISGDVSPEIMEKALSIGASDVLLKPFQFSDIENLIARVHKKGELPLIHIMNMIQKISGNRLGEEKKTLVETRIMRRIRRLELKDINEYLIHFNKSPGSEVQELISLFTTHTTEFFREKDHYFYLENHIFPKFKAGSVIRIWSAACSTGEEVYSLAICAMEYLKKNNLQNAIKVEILGTDIDFNAVNTAGEGIYPYSYIERLPPHIARNYFETAEIDGEKWVRVNDEIFSLCSFNQHNLLSSQYHFPKFDVIFLRNVLIYFPPKEITFVMKQLHEHLHQDGFLFLGHSESLLDIQSKFKLIGNSIYVSTDNKIIQIKKDENKKSKIDVLIVDDSKTIRVLLKNILSEKEGFHIVAEAENPIEAEKILEKNPVDVMTLDIHMPEKDGITYLAELQKKKDPPKVVMVSSISLEDATNALSCFDLGAMDYIEKPSAQNLSGEADRIRTVVRAAFNSKKMNYKDSSLAGNSNTQTTFKEKLDTISRSPFDLLLMGASTGGVESLRVVLKEIPKNSPPIMIVQHIPAHFSAALARRLNDECSIKVVEASGEMKVEHGTAYIAPGGKQLKLIERGNVFYVVVTDDPPVNLHKPSVDYMFASALKLKSKINIAAALLTGMGKDGANELKNLKDKGHYTIAQNEETCIVYGMPKAAVDIGAAVSILPLQSIGYHLFKGPGSKDKQKKTA